MLRCSSTSTRPVLIPSIPRIYIANQSRSYRNRIWRQPKVFHQTIVLTDGSTFKVRSSSPRQIYRLTHDKFSNHLWTGRRGSEEEDEQDQRLTRFRKAYEGGIDGDVEMKMLKERRQKGREGLQLTADKKADSADLLFKMMEHEDAFVPTKGREPGDFRGQQKTKGIRT
jgi:hypothetical protein